MQQINDNQKLEIADISLDLNVILPGFRAMVFDPWANGREGYWNNKGEYRAATVIKRYGFVSEWMEAAHGREAAIYPDCVDVIFDHDGRVSKSHFTEGLRMIKST